MRAVGYFRQKKTNEWSSINDSFELQFEEYCAVNFHQNLGIYVDNLGSKNEYKKLLEFLSSSGSEYLVAIPDSRHLGSDLEELTRSLIAIDATGSSSICMDDLIPDPIQNGFQRLGIKGVSKTRSDRVRESMRAKAAQGKPLGRPPFGYEINEDGDLVIVPGQASVVELIYRLYTKDQIGFRLIAQQLNERGITTRKNKPWNVVTVRDILRNVAYTGTYSRFGLRKSKVHEAVISTEIFKLAQDITKTRRPIGRVSSADPFLLSGLVYCADCGNKMMGVTRRQKWQRKDSRRSSGVYRYYQCQSRQNQGRCSYVTWRASMLESTVIGRLIENIKNAIDKKDLLNVNESSRIDRIRELNRDRVKSAERRMLFALKRVAKAEIPLDLMSEYIKNIDSARKLSSKSRDVEPEAILSKVKRIESLKYEEKRVIFEENIMRITVHKEMVDISF